MLKVALSGGIASGKTKVSDTLLRAGASVIDTDVLAREVVAPGSDGLSEIADRLGPQFLMDDGALDRAALRKHIFQDADARRTLESITHPRIGQAVREQMARATGPYVVIVVPLLNQSPLRALVDRVLIVDCDPGLQIRRLLDRDGGDPRLAMQILAAQASRSARLALATDVIENSGSLESLVRRSAQLHRFYCQLSA